MLFWLNFIILNRAIFWPINKINLIKMDLVGINIKFNINSISSLDLYNPDVFEAIKYQACNLVDSLDWDNALKYANQLEEKISGIKPKNNNQQSIHIALQFWILRLRLFSYGSLSAQDKTDFIKKELGRMLSLGLDVKRSMVKYLDFYGSIGLLQKESEGIAYAITNSEEVFGKNIQGFQNANFKPTIANWVKEYQSILKSSSGVKIQPGAFHIVKFIGSNPYVKYLDQEEREILKEILDLYNWLLSPVIYDSGTKNSSQSQPYTNQQNFALPADLQENASIQQSVPPVVPLPPKAVGKKPMEEVSGKPAAPLPAVYSKTKIQGYDARQSGSFNVQDFLNKSAQEYSGRGLNFGGLGKDAPKIVKTAAASGSDAKTQPVPAAESTEQKIDKKLRDLENRTKENK